MLYAAPNAPPAALMLVPVTEFYETRTNCQPIPVLLSNALSEAPVCSAPMLLIAYHTPPQIAAIQAARYSTSWQSSRRVGNQSWQRNPKRERTDRCVALSLLVRSVRGSALAGRGIAGERWVG